MKITLADVSVRYRCVELLDACVSCNADLRQPGAMRAWEYQDQVRHGHLDPEAPSGFAFNEDEVPEGGQEFVAYVSYHCARCGAVLAAGDEKSSDESESAQGHAPAPE